MAKRVFIVDEHISSKQNGVGSFMATFLSCLKDTDIDVNLVSYNEEVKDFCIKKKDGYHLYCIPVYGMGANTFPQNCTVSLSLLRLYIPDHQDNIFFVSHSPCVEFLELLKTLFPQSKRVFSIHDQGWTASLLGNQEKLKELMSMKRFPAKKKAEYAFVRKYTKDEQKMYALVHRVVCLNQSTYNLLQDVYNVPKDKISVIPNGFSIAKEAQADRMEIRQKLGILPDEKILLFAGRTVKAKGIFELLDAFEKVWKEHPKIRLVIAGQVFNLNEYVSHTPESATHVSYTGLVSKERINEWYRAADIGVLPSYTEQCSYTALEMMANWLPMITTDGNGLRDMVTDKKSAFIISANPDSLTEDLAKAIQQMLNLSPKKKENVVNRAYKRVSTEYTIENMKKRYVELFTNL